MNGTLNRFLLHNDDKIDKELNKILIFRLYGNFAHFNQPFGNRFRNTYSIIPKPQLLGLIGSIIGLEGYKNNTTYPEFYKLLKNLKVFIKVNSVDKKFIVKYNSLNSFLSNRVMPEMKDGKVKSSSPNVIINEQVLLHPDYEIGLLLNENNDLHKTIIEKIKYNSSIFMLYLGKNEFPASIEFLSLNEYELNTNKEIKIQSIIRLDAIEEYNENMRLDSFPVDFDENFKYIYDTMCIPQGECKVTLKNPCDCIISKNELYYVY